MSPTSWVERAWQGPLLGGEKMPDMLLPQKPWGRGALEMT